MRGSVRGDDAGCNASYTVACQHSWATGGAAHWLEERLEQKLDSLPGAPRLHELVGRLGHRHVTSRKPQQELLLIARRHCGNVFLRSWLRAVSAGAETGHHVLRAMKVGEAHPSAPAVAYHCTVLASLSTNVSAVCPC